MENSDQHTPATLIAKDDGRKLLCMGAWTLAGIAHVEQHLPKIRYAQEIEIDGSGITAMDSAGAWLIQRLRIDLEKQAIRVKLNNFSSQQQELLSVIASKSEKIASLPAEPTSPPLFYIIGKETVRKYNGALDFFAFIGEVTMNFFHVLTRPRLLEIRSVLSTIETAGYYALPIIALLSFLIGIVLAYQIGYQLQDYGVNVYIVNILGFSILREFAPLVTAIIMAGRTGSAFTAQIGIMKINEEIDALYVMGLSPINRLVLPKFIGLLIVFPLLTLWSSFFGILGGMVMAKSVLGVGYDDFIQRFQEVVQAKVFWVGMSKVPTFALIIAAVGCFQGFQASGSADSVGWQTTKSVVQAIFLIIVADAIYSIVYGWLGI